MSGFLETFSLLSHDGTAIIIENFQVESYLKKLAKFKPTLICTHVAIIFQLLDSGLCHYDTFDSLWGIYKGGDELPSIARYILVVGIFTEHSLIIP